jgi:hypothetical protein
MQMISAVVTKGIIGGVLAAVFIVVVVIVIGCVLRRRMRSSAAGRRQQQPTSTTAVGRCIVVHQIPSANDGARLPALLQPLSADRYLGNAGYRNTDWHRCPGISSAFEMPPPAYESVLPAPYDEPPHLYDSILQSPTAPQNNL